MHKEIVKLCGYIIAQSFVLLKIKICLQGLFTPFEITSIQETTLGANQWLKDNERLQFGTTGTLEEVVMDKYSSFNESEMKNRRSWMDSLNDLNSQKKRAVLIDVLEDDVNDLVITLNPMQIRTFVIEIKKSDI